MLFFLKKMGGDEIIGKKEKHFLLPFQRRRRFHYCQCRP
jgi:hypothetical protein